MGPHRRVDVALPHGRCSDRVSRSSSSTLNPRPHGSAV
jgi:hypothetical protein